MNLCWDKNSNFKNAMYTYRNIKKARILLKPYFTYNDSKYKDFVQISLNSNNLITNTLTRIIAKGENVVNQNSAKTASTKWPLKLRKRPASLPPSLIFFFF